MELIKEMLGLTPALVQAQVAPDVTKESVIQFAPTGRGLEIDLDDPKLDQIFQLVPTTKTIPI